MNEKTYNGWTNYETWNVALWIDNEEGSYSYRCDMAQQAYDNAAPDELSTRLENAEIELADMVEEWIRDSAPEVNGLFGDLLGAALSEVNWREIAENFLGDIDQTESPELDCDSDE